MRAASALAEPGTPSPPLALPQWNWAAVTTDAESGFALVESDSGRRIVPYRSFGDGFTSFGTETEYELDYVSGEYLVIDEDGRVGDRLWIVACGPDEESLKAPAVPIRAAAAEPPAPPARKPDYDEELGF